MRHGERRHHVAQEVSSRGNQNQFTVKGGALMGTLLLERPQVRPSVKSSKVMGSRGGSPVTDNTGQAAQLCYKGGLMRVKKSGHR